MAQLVESTAKGLALAQMTARSIQPYLGLMIEDQLDARHQLAHQGDRIHGAQLERHLDQTFARHRPQPDKAPTTADVGLQAQAVALNRGLSDLAEWVRHGQSIAHRRRW